MTRISPLVNYLSSSQILRVPTPPQAAHYIKTRKRSDDEGIMKGEAGVPWMEGLAVHTV